MTKVTILTQYFYPENVTSATLAYELATTLAQKDYQVRAIVGMPHEYYKGKAKQNEIIEGVDIRRIKYAHLNRKTKVGRLRNYFSFFSAVLRNRKLFRDTDVLLVYSSPPIIPIIPAIFSRRYGFKLVYIVHDLYPDIATKFGYMSVNGISRKLLDRANTFVYNRCSKIIVLSNEMKDYFSEHKGHDDKLVVIPNWYREESEPAVCDTPDEVAFNVIYGGNIGIVQDIDTILNGIEKLSKEKDVRFLFAAHGSRKGEFFAEIERRNIPNVKDLGYLDKIDYDKMIHSAKLAIVSVDSKVAGLASPSKYYSYLAKGIPVLFIGPDSMDVAREIKSNNTGYIIANNDADSFADAVIHAKTNSKLHRIMCKNSATVFKLKYTKDICTERFVELIGAIVMEG